MALTQSILDSVKKNLGIDAEYEFFDQDILLHINAVFGTLQQLGVGPADGFEIEDNTAVWTDFIADDKKLLNPVKTYVFLRVRLLFDPPQTSYLQAALENQVKEFEWRLNVVREEETWVPPPPDPPNYVYIPQGLIENW